MGDATDWSAVSAAQLGNCGLRGGAIYCWGNNDLGQTGQRAAWTTTPVAIEIP